MWKIVEQETYVMMLLMQQFESLRRAMVIKVGKTCKVCLMLSPIYLEIRIHSGIDQWMLQFNCIERCGVSKGNVVLHATIEDIMQYKTLLLGLCQFYIELQ